MRAGSLLLCLLLSACAGVERRTDCTVQVLDHPSKPRPAGRIVVLCDGLRRATIDAEHVYTGAP
jgi:hypothetical protein